MQCTYMLVSANRILTKLPGRLGRLLCRTWVTFNKYPQPTCIWLIYMDIKITQCTAIISSFNALPQLHGPSPGPRYLRALGLLPPHWSLLFQRINAFGFCCRWDFTWEECQSAVCYLWSRSHTQLGAEGHTKVVKCWNSPKTDKTLKDHGHICHPYPHQECHLPP